MSKNNKLEIAYEYCKKNDKSIEFMLQYLQDFANVGFYKVLKFIKDKNEIK